MSTEFVRPGEQVIAAYVSGSATEQEKSIIQVAMIGSPAFRAEIRDMVIESETIISISDVSLPDYDAVSVPDRVGFLKRRGGNSVSGNGDISFMDKLAKIIRSRFYVPAVAVAAILVLLIYGDPFLLHDRSHIDSTDLILVQHEVPKEMLIPVSTRAAATSSRMRIFDSAEKAALHEIRYLITWQQGDFSIGEQRPQDTSSAPCKDINIQLATTSGQQLREFVFHLPVTDSLAESPLMVWALALPSRNLYNAPLLTDTAKIIWPGHSDSIGCLTITRAVAGGYQSLASWSFDLH